MDGVANSVRPFAIAFVFLSAHTSSDQLITSDLDESVLPLIIISPNDVFKNTSIISTIYNK